MPVDERSDQMQFLNQYSFVILGVFLIMVLVLWRLREGFRRQDWIAIAALAGGFLLAFGFFRPTSQSDAPHQFENELGQGQPMLVTFQSPYCLACMSARPFLDRIEQENPDLTVVRIDVQDPAASNILSEYDFQYTPTFIMFDPQGEELWRVAGAIDPDWVGETLESLP
jgi:thiol-disulfide isomerase/thioredoxin